MLLLCAAALGPNARAAASLPDWAVAPITAELGGLAADADAVVLLDTWTFTTGGERRTGLRRRIVRVLTEDGIEDAVVPLYRDSFHRFDRVRVWVRSPEGAVKRFDEDDGTLWATSSRKLLDDAELLAIDAPGVFPGAVVALEYRFSQSSAYVQAIVGIEEELPVLLKEVRVQPRDGWSVRTRVAPGSHPGPEVATQDASWRFERLPAVTSDDDWFAPEPPRTEMLLEFLAPGARPMLADWAAVAAWSGAKFALPAAGPQLTAAAARMAGTPEEMIAEAGRLARALRYFAIEIGWGGLVPRDPEVTLSRGLGDCKDKAQLMVALLRARGIRAVPALAMAPSHGYVDEALPSFRHFNHAIVAIPWDGRSDEGVTALVDVAGLGRVRLFDATLDPADPDVSPLLEGGAILILDGVSRPLVRVPDSSAEENRIERRATWRLRTDGPAAVELTARYGGAMRAHLLDDAGSWMRPDDLRRELFPDLAGSCPDLQDLAVRFEAPEGGAPGVVTASYTCPSALRRFGDRLAIELPGVDDLDLFPLPHEGEGPRAVHTLHTIAETVAVELPGWQPVALAAPVSVASDLGAVSASLTRRSDGAVVLERTTSVRARRLPYERRADVLALHEALRGADQLRAVFERAP